MDAGSLAAWSVALPLAAAVVVAVAGARAAGPVMGVMVVAVPALAWGVARSVLEHGPQTHLLGGWGAPLGIELHVDGLSALLLGMTAVVGAATSLYARAYFSRGGERAFWPVWLFLWAGLNGVFLSDDLFNMYVTLELLGLGAVSLVALAGSRDASVAAMRYLLISMAGSLLFLLGVAILYATAGTLSVSRLATLHLPGPALATALAAMTVGMLAKTALFPLHAWLPPAHATAPAPASAILSGLVVKASFYLVLRLWVTLAPEAMGAGVGAGAGVRGAETAALALGVLGAGAVLWGSVLALRQTHAKRLVAYSTVAQLGYLFILFPLLADASGEWSRTAWHGGAYQAVSHGVAKAAMFLAVGTMAYAVGTDRIRAFAGLAHRMPLTFAAFGLAGLSLVGLPPSGGFLAKWLMLHAAIDQGAWGWAVVLVVGSLLAAAYVFLILRSAFEWTADPELRAAAREERSPDRLVPLRMELPALALALVAAALGVWATGMLRLLDVGLPGGVQ
jgi:multicomponent Na+:H+ antiporter subunit D